MSRIVTPRMFFRVAAILGFSLLLVNCPSTPKPPTETVAAPAYAPAEGSYTEAQEVAITTSTEGAEIRYTTDGSAPSATSGTVYGGPVSVTETTTLRAIAVKTGMNDSPVTSATYTIKATTTTTTTTTTTVEPVTDDEIMQARNALARAKEVDADFFDPGNYDAARRSLDEGVDLRTKDPATAHKRLADAKEKADLAFTNSVERAAADMASRMEAARKRLLDIEADRFLTDDYQNATAGIDETNQLYKDEKYADGRARGYQALKEMTDLYNRLAQRLTDVRQAKYETEQLMKQAEDEELYQYAPGQREKVTGLYLAGVDSLQGYKLDDAEENFGAAREAAKETIRIAQEARDAQQAAAKAKAEELQKQVMKSLVDASKLTVVGEDGSVSKPKNWTEDEFLGEIDRMMQEEQQKQQASPQSMVIPADGSTAVMADDQEAASLLQQARDLWTQGLKEKAAGNYAKAVDYFTEAQRYIDIYKSFAVKGVYTVRLIPERRDCLWRIAEYKDIYGDPYKWPNIWRRNRKLIQNPDLIYPGWQLVIPPD
jgi:nucleoid-associated protein YgaU